MNRFEQLLVSSNARPVAVVHLGAGSCKEYSVYKTLGATRIFFVEPDRKLARQAKDKFGSSSDVSIIDHAVAAQNGRRLINITNNPRFNSLLPPSGLLDFYPNVSVTDQPEIDTVTLGQLCDDMGLDGKTDNLLVAELQGLEKDIFPSSAKNTLAKFKWILISSSEHELYKPDSDLAQKDLHQVMRDAGYTVLVFNEDASPHTNILCIRNEAIIKNVLLEQKNSGLAKSIISFKQTVTKYKTDLKNKEKGFKKQLVDVEESLQAKSDELAQLLNKLESVNKEKTALSRELKVLTERLEKRTDENSHLQAEHSQLQAENSELKVEHSKLQAEDSELKVKHSKLQTEQSELKVKHSKSQTESSELKVEHSKLQTEKSELKIEHSKLQTEKSELKIEHSKLQTENSELKVEHSKLQTENSELKVEHSKLQTENSELKVEHSKLQTENSELKVEHSKSQTENSELKAEHSKLNTENSELKADTTKLAGEATTLSEKIAENARESAQMQQTLRINNKLMLKSNADLSDLHVQYSTALQHQEQQHSLLCELKGKLRQASEYYQKLNLQNLALDGDMLNKNDSVSGEPVGKDDDKT